MTTNNQGFNTADLNNPIDFNNENLNNENELTEDANQAPQAEGKKKPNYAAVAGVGVAAAGVTGAAIYGASKFFGGDEDVIAETEEDKQDDLLAENQNNHNHHHHNPTPAPAIEPEPEVEVVDEVDPADVAVDESILESEPQTAYTIDENNVMVDDIAEVEVDSDNIVDAIVEDNPDDLLAVNDVYDMALSHDEIVDSIVDDPVYTLDDDLSSNYMDDNLGISDDIQMDLMA